MAKRNIMRIDLTRPALRQIAAMTARFGATHLTVQSRLVEWFSKQDASLQREIMSWDPDAPDSRIAERILKKMASRA